MTNQTTDITFKDIALLALLGFGGFYGYNNWAAIKGKAIAMYEAEAKPVVVSAVEPAPVTGPSVSAFIPAVAIMPQGNIMVYRCSAACKWMRGTKDDCTNNNCLIIRTGEKPDDTSGAVPDKEKRPDSSPSPAKPAK